MDVSHKQTKEYLFEKAPILAAMAELAVPTIVGMLVVIAYNFAAAYFIGRLNDPNQMAAITVATPVFMIFMAIGALFGIGGSSFVARLLGKKDYESAKRVSAFVFYGSITAGLIYTLCTFLLLDVVLGHLGATEAIYNYVREYVVIIVAVSPLIILSFSMGQIARSEGAAKVAMGGMMLGTFTNIILDPIFILWMGMGVKGAAYAAVVANCFTSVYYIRYFTKKSPWLSISPKYIKPTMAVVLGTLSIGVPAFVSNILLSSANLILNNHAVIYGESVVAAIGIVYRVIMLPTFVIMGLCQGVMPLIGYNYSSGNRSRMISTINHTLVVSLIIAFVLGAVLAVTSPQVVRIFLDDDEVVKNGALYLRVLIIGIPFMAVGFLYSATFQALGKAIPALLVTVVRQGLVFIPVLIIADNLIGVSGLVLAQPVSDVVSMLITILIFIKVKSEMQRRVCIKKEERSIS